MNPFSKIDFSKLDFARMDFAKMDFSKFGVPKSDEARAGRTARVMEAMGKQAAAYAKWAEAQRTAAEAQRTAAEAAASTGAAAGDNAPTIDMVAPDVAGGAWTAPSAEKPRAPSSGAAPKAESKAEPAVEPAGAAFDLSGMMRTLRDSLPKGALDGVPGMTAPAPVTVPDGARFEERTFTSAVGSRSYKVYVPSGYAGQPLPVVIMLHGCSQNPDDFAAGTRMNAVAEEQTFLVAYPGQPQSAHMQRCWNWYTAGDQQREGGEPALIAGIARAVIDEFSADPSRIYAAGLSAGGAAAAILAATYPDLFAAVGVHSGLACGAARDVPSAFAAMKGGSAASAGRDRHAVPTIVFHGDGDRTVHPANGDQVIAQSRSRPDLKKAVSEGRTPDGVAYTRTVRTDASGRAMLEQWVLHGAGHAWSGGSPAGSFTDPRGPDASREMMRFFLAHTNAAGAARN